MEEVSFEEEKQKASKTYVCVGKRSCPALNNIPVFFTSEGFHHLQFKNQRERPHSDVVGRFREISTAAYIISVSTTIQEHYECIQEVVVRVKKRKERCSKLVTYWGFVAVIKGRRVKVILRKVGDGNTMFWSVIPNWKIEKYGNIRYKNNSEGDLAND